MKLLFEEEKVAAGGHQVASLVSLSKSNFVKYFVLLKSTIINHEGIAWCACGLSTQIR